MIIAVPFRHRQRWAWWAAWILLLADLSYRFTFGVHDHPILVRSLFADIALPVLLLAHIPVFFRRPRIPAPGGWRLNRSGRGSRHRGLS